MLDNELNIKHQHCDLILLKIQQQTVDIRVFTHINKIKHSVLYCLVFNVEPLMSQRFSFFKQNSRTDTQLMTPVHRHRWMFSEVCLFASYLLSIKVFPCHDFSFSSSSWSYSCSCPASQSSSWTSPLSGVHLWASCYRGHVSPPSAPPRTGSLASRPAGSRRAAAATRTTAAASPPPPNNDSCTSCGGGAGGVSTRRAWWSTAG